ncbi:hypothetical protein [Gordonia soli]|uniref:RNA polymerase sigma-70 region 4 domain-containing protein n=1 Tax=Gordonia soli NBRC 108243 TaxID=1223545 RepID=M0QRF2_9ACTN|nr:hypothetical protein [Gordonia soli]GAC70886.1 hypothetical protein GS4_43_00120 [Gordonia soli NBRC 108243]
MTSNPARELGVRPWLDVLPWLGDYRDGPPILAPDEVIVNSWIHRSPADTLTDTNIADFCSLLAERYVADRPGCPLADDFPGIDPAVPLDGLPVSASVRRRLSGNGIHILQDLIAGSVGDLLARPRIGTAAAVEVAAALVGVAAHTATASTAEAATTTGDHGDVESFAAALTDRDRLVLRERILSSRPRTQTELAGMIGTSRERVTQMDRGIRRRLVELIDGSPHLRALRADIDGHAHPVVDADDLVADDPDLGKTVASLDVPTWRLVAAGSVGLHAVDDWIVRGSMKEVTTQTRSSVDEAATPEGVAPVPVVADSLNLTTDAARRWLQRSGYAVVADHAVPSSASTGDLVAGVLAIAGEPRTFDEILGALLEFPRAPSSVRNALVTDERIVKTDRHTYGLRRWGLQRYVPVHRQIDRILAAADGPVPIADMIATIRGDYDVTESSIRAYASAGEFITRDEMVSRRERPYAPRKTPTRTRGLYRDGESTHWATTITAAHIKGSAFNIPSALASIIGVAPGSPVRIPSDHGPQSFMWVSVQARSGTIKRFVTDLGLAEGDPVFLDFSPQGFGVRRDTSARATTPAARIVESIGRSPGRRRPAPEALRAILTDALWLPPDSASELTVATLRRRRENDLADLVQQTVG